MPCHMEFMLQFSSQNHHMTIAKQLSSLKMEDRETS